MTVEESKSDPHDLIVKTNEYLPKIDYEIMNLVRSIRDKYFARFAELEQIVPAPIQYVKCVKLIANQQDLTTVNFASIGIPNNVIMSLNCAVSIN